MTVPRRVSIGIPTINRSSLALRAIRSALSQTYSDVEVIVSDDASTDDTVERIREIRDPRLVLVEQKERLGLVGNFDFCLRHATGEFFLLLGDDDVLLPNAIERLVEPFLLGKASIPANAMGVVWCPCRIASTANSQFWITEAGPNRICLFHARCAVCRRSRSSAHQHFDPNDRMPSRSAVTTSKYGDLVRYRKLGPRRPAARIRRLHSEPLVQYTQHQGSTTSQSSIQQWQHWARVDARTIY